LPVGTLIIPLEAFPNSFQTGVDQEPDVRHAQFRDLADLPVAEPVLQLESDAFLLVVWQSVELQQDARDALVVFHLPPRFGLTEIGFEDRRFGEGRHPRLLASEVDGLIPADGIQTLDEVIVQRLFLLTTQLEESFLHCVASPFGVPGDSLRVLDQSPFVSTKGRRHPVPRGMAVPGHQLDRLQK